MEDQQSFILTLIADLQKHTGHLLPHQVRSLCGMHLACVSFRSFQILADNKLETSRGRQLLSFPLLCLLQSDAVIAKLCMKIFQTPSLIGYTAVWTDYKDELVQLHNGLIAMILSHFDFSSYGNDDEVMKVDEASDKERRER